MSPPFLLVQKYLIFVRIIRGIFCPDKKNLLWKHYNVLNWHANNFHIYFNIKNLELEENQRITSFFYFRYWSISSVRTDGKVWLLINCIILTLNAAICFFHFCRYVMPLPSLPTCRITKKMSVFSWIAIYVCVSR